LAATAAFWCSRPASACCLSFSISICKRPTCKHDEINEAFKKRLSGDVCRVCGTVSVFVGYVTSLADAAARLALALRALSISATCLERSSRGGSGVMLATAGAFRLR
jgi:hypothetical protein